MFHFLGISVNHPAGPELTLWHYIPVFKWQYQRFFSSQKDTCKYVLPFFSMFWNVIQEWIYLVHISQSSEDPLQNATINSCRFHCRPLLPTRYWAAPASTSLYGDAAISSWKPDNENTGEQYAYWRLLLSLRIQAFMNSQQGAWEKILITPVGKTLTF